MTIGQTIAAWLNRPSPAVSDRQRAAWDRDGVLILRGFMTPAEIDGVVSLIGSLDRPETRPAILADRVTIDVLHGPLIGRRMRLGDAPAGTFDGPVKINDLFLESDEVRACCLAPRLVGILNALIDGEPAVCNSLNFMAGSEQPAHIDSWFMPPPAGGRLIVSSICLEDVRPDAGPVFYYPGSHKIPPYRFSNGGMAAISAEMAECQAYLDAEIASRGLKAETFLGQRGDVLIWHQQLVHGGSPIQTPGATRASLVTHYWRAAELDPSSLKPAFGGRYLVRAHQPVPA